MLVYKNWARFCATLTKTGISCVLAREAVSAAKANTKFIIIKHDVETNVKKSLALAHIEQRNGIRATYYVQSNLVDDAQDIKMLQQIQSLGHEVTYHYDVLDANNGDMDKADSEFQATLDKFERHGFKVLTVCPHGNPILNRNGWSSNKDFFRDPKVAARYEHITDIVIDLPKMVGNKLTYISDAGYKLKLIADIANNDKDDSQPDITLAGFDEIVRQMSQDGSVIISTHPHRWYKYQLALLLKVVFFKFARMSARFLSKNQAIKKFLSKYYYIAKKI